MAGAEAVGWLATDVSAASGRCASQSAGAGTRATDRGTDGTGKAPNRSGEAAAESLRVAGTGGSRSAAGGGHLGHRRRCWTLGKGGLGRGWLWLGLDGWWRRGGDRRREGSKYGQGPGERRRNATR